MMDQEQRVSISITGDYSSRTDGLLVQLRCFTFAGSRVCFLVHAGPSRATLGTPSPKES